MLLLKDVKLSESDESMSYRFSISVSSMSNKFSTEVSTKCYCGTTDFFGELEFCNIIISFMVSFHMSFLSNYDFSINTF